MSSVILLPILLVLSLLTSSNAAPNCPLMGPTFPRPQNLAKSSSLQPVLKNLTDTLNQWDAVNTTGTGTNSYSIQLFSAHDDNAIFEHYHTAPNLASIRPGGVSKVDADTVYRIGSLTKCFTMFTFLVEAGDIHFNDPITKYVPELASMAGNSSNDPITKVSWADVTIGELASHMAGIGADYSVVGELALTLGNNATRVGFPPLPDVDVPACGAYPLCNRKQLLDGFAVHHPAFATGETPVYSNVAFQILSYALENITGQSFQSSLEDKVLKPLSLTHTSYATPNESLGVIPGDMWKTEWAFDMGDETPAGGIFSSAGDMASFGRSILKSSVLSPAQTRRWLKPATVTSDPRESVGYPWGIRRITPNPDQPYTMVTAFIKAGTIGAYSALLTLLPDYNIGFVILISGDLTLSNWALADLIGAAIIPAMDVAAREEAQIYVGKYSSTTLSTSTNSTLNSSLTIALNDGRPGLGVSEWISNGTNMLAVIDSLLTGADSPTFDTRLYPTDLASTDGRQKAFKAIFDDIGNTLKDTWFTAACGTWIGPTGLVYGGMALDEFVFNLDDSGSVVSAEPAAMRLSLNKTG